MGLRDSKEGSAVPSCLLGPSVEGTALQCEVPVLPLSAVEWDCRGN